LQAVKLKMTRKMRDLKASILISVQVTILPVTVRSAAVHWGRMFTICGEKNSLWSQKSLILLMCCI
jgi:hypothetical protein